MPFANWTVLLKERILITNTLLYLFAEYIYTIVLTIKENKFADISKKKF